MQPTLSKRGSSKQSHIVVRPPGEMAAEELRYRVVADQIVNLTRSKAYQFLEFESFAGERETRERHVQHLYDEFVAGRFVWHHVILAAAIIWEKSAEGEMRKRTYRLNGQHTAWMRVSIPTKDDPPSSKVREIIYEVPGMEELRSLYAAFDRCAPRTNAHITKTLLVDTATSQGLAMSNVNHLVAGMRFWLWEKTANRIARGTPQEVAALIQSEYPALFRNVAGFFGQHYSEWHYLKRAPLVAALFATFNKAPDDAVLFWSSVCNGLGFESKQDARLMLRNYTENHTHSIRSRTCVSVSQEEMYRIAIQAWNRWRKHESVVMLRPTETRTKAH